MSNYGIQKRLDEMPERSVGVVGGMPIVKFAHEKFAFGLHDHVYSCEAMAGIIERHDKQFSFSAHSA
jgi:hypothetical protein